MHLHPVSVQAAWFEDNAALVESVNAQPLAAVLTCLGDGDDGIWNLLTQILPKSERREILDWFDLMENLEKVGGALNRLAQARSLLWQGKVDETIALFEDSQLHQAQCFCQYLHKHQQRPNYDYLKAENICAGSLWCN